MYDMIPTYLLQEGEKQKSVTKKDRVEMFPVLYGVTKTGNVKWYTIEVKHFKDRSEIYRIHASKIGGKSQTDIKEITSGVNIGKANETSIEQQAVFVAQSMYKAKQDEGYKTADDLGLVINAETGEYTMNNVTNNTDASGRIKPMLASEYENEEYPCFTQPKYDGLRCIAQKEKGKINLFSREGKPIYNKRIQVYLDKTLKNGDILDGELYCHGKPLQKIASIVKREKTEHEDADKLVYVVFDIPVMNVTWENRLKRIQAFGFETFSGNTKYPVTISATYHCPNKKVLDEYHKQFLKSGFEGTIIRLYNGMYESGFRSNALIKKKVKNTDEFEIVGVEEAQGRDKGTAIFVCKTKEGKEFNCRPMGTKEVRTNYFLAKKTLIGKKLTVEFRGYTPDDKKPFQPVGVAIRDYE